MLSDDGSTARELSCRSVTLRILLRETILSLQEALSRPFSQHASHLAAAVVAMDSHRLVDVQQATHALVAHVVRVAPAVNAWTAALHYNNRPSAVSHNRVRQTMRAQMGFERYWKFYCLTSSV